MAHQAAADVFPCLEVRIVQFPHSFGGVGFEADGVELVAVVRAPNPDQMLTGFVADEVYAVLIRKLFLLFRPLDCLGERMLFKLIQRA